MLACRRHHHPVAHGLTKSPAANSLSEAVARIGQGPPSHIAGSSLCFHEHFYRIMLTHDPMML